MKIFKYSFSSRLCLVVVSFLVVFCGFLICNNWQLGFSIYLPFFAVPMIFLIYVPYIKGSDMFTTVALKSNSTFSELLRIFLVFLSHSVIAATVTMWIEKD